MHTKIVCTLGPASSSPETIEAMIKAGMNIARLNLSYGNNDERIDVISAIRSVSNKLNRSTGIMLDLPGYKRRKGSIAEVFQDQLEFACKHEVDFIALSFISSAQQVKDVRTLLDTIDPDMPLIVKIEQAEALQDCENILAVCQGVMVARGDLALEISIEKVPLAQKLLINKANRLGIPVITATQMLESMVRNSSPTRAEATDVTNAILDGTDAIMLSEESAVGKYPVEAVAMMKRIATEAETAIQYEETLNHMPTGGILPEVNDATARAACQIAHQINAKAILVFTSGGTTALRVSKYRPKQPVIAVTHNERVVKRMSLPWGVIPVFRPEPGELEKVFEISREVALKTGYIGKGDHIVITAGLPLRTAGRTNLVRVQEI
ncbi:MAG: pyruvate kinase [Dehalococcoidales bacterium]|nr:pyruvate kinase [Dehalococcoidales bacterium]